MIIVVTMPDGTRWAIPAERVAEERSRYYAALDARRSNGNYDQRYAEEYAYSLRAHHVLIEYAENNMNWSDFADHAVQVAHAPVGGASSSYELAWPNADKVVVAMAMPSRRPLVPRPASQVQLTDTMIGWLMDQILKRYPQFQTGVPETFETSDQALAAGVLAALARDAT